MKIPADEIAQISTKYKIYKLSDQCALRICVKVLHSKSKEYRILFGHCGTNMNVFHSSNVYELQSY